MDKRLIALIILALIANLNALSYEYYKTLNGTEGTGSWDEFQRPSQVFIDSAGKIYVLNMPVAAHTIIKIYNPDLNYSNSKGTFGVDNMQFNDPRDIFVDKNGTIYVADTSNSRIQKFKIDSTTSTIIGQTGSIQYALTLPQGVIVDEFENVYIADTSNDRIIILNKNGLINATIDKVYKEGDQNYAFKTPKGVFLAPDEKIYITDSGNNRVQIFNKNLTFFGRVGTVGSTLNDPTKTFVDPKGKIYVADKGNNRIQIYDSNLTYITTIGGTTGNETYELNQPEGVGVDSKGFVYVADTGNNRVQIFKPISEELLKDEAINAINAGLNASATASGAIKAAENKIDYILSANCISPLDSLNSLNLSKFYYQMANSSLADALLNYNSKKYEKAALNATYAKINATEAELKANASIYYSDSYWNTPDQQPGLTFDKLIALNKEIDYLKNLSSAGAAIGSAANQSAIDNVFSRLNDATSKCRTGRYSESSKAAGDTSNSLELIVEPLEREIDYKLRVALDENEKLLTEIKENITKFNLGISTTGVESKISTAYSYLRNSSYIPTIPLVLSINGEIYNLTLVASGNATAFSSTYDLIRAEINSTEEMLLLMADSMKAYKQNINLSKVDELINVAKLNLSLSNFSEANESIMKAREEITLLWSSLNLTVLKIDNATAAIAQANASIASSKPFLFLAPNLNDAKRLLAEALSTLYSDPDDAKMLADNATALVNKEVRRIDSLKSSLVFGLIIIIIVIALVIFALRYHRSARKRKGERHGRERRERDVTYI